MMKTSFLAFLWSLLISSPLWAEEPRSYRTDDNPDKNLPWFQVVAGEFPPADAAHYISGELIGMDHPYRTFTLRVDRNDGQGAALFDYPIDAAMLPYGSIYYHNQPAALSDIPIGTHMHGWFFKRPENECFWEERNGRLHSKKDQRASQEVDFTHCFRLEDDFTYYSRKQQMWKIDHVDLTTNKLTATLQQAGAAVGKPHIFDLQSHTTVYQGNGFGTLKNIAPGQLVQMNITWATLYGPGRVFHLWLDEQSRAVAEQHQLERHRNYMREHGMPGFVTAVDDKNRIVTITFFDGADPALFKEFTIPNPKPLGWPTSEYQEGNLSPKGNIVVALDFLMTYDQVNDRKGGNILKISEVPVRPGCSGVQIQVQCGLLLEGFRPKRIVRFFPATWPVISLPREEKYEGRE